MSSNKARFSRTSANSVQAQQQIDTIIGRIQKLSQNQQSSDQILLPDEVSSALGRQLAIVYYNYLNGTVTNEREDSCYDDEVIGRRILSIFISSSNITASDTFYLTLASAITTTTTSSKEDNYYLVLLDIWLSWILQLISNYQAPAAAIAGLVVKGYTQIAVLLHSRKSQRRSRRNHVIEVYQRLDNYSNLQLIILSETISIVFSTRNHDGSDILIEFLLCPLLLTCLLSRTNRIEDVVMYDIFRRCRNHEKQQLAIKVTYLLTKYTVVDYLQHFTFIQEAISSYNPHDYSKSIIPWVMHLLELVHCNMESIVLPTVQQRQKPQQMMLLQSFIHPLFCYILPTLLCRRRRYLPSNATSIIPLLDSCLLFLLKVCSYRKSTHTGWFIIIHPHIFIQLATCILSLSNEAEIDKMLQIMVGLLQCNNLEDNCSLIQNICAGLSCVFSASTSPSLLATSHQLHCAITATEEITQSTNRVQQDQPRPAAKHIIEALLSDPNVNNVDLFFKYIEKSLVKENDEQSSSCIMLNSITLQSTLLLLGLTLLLQLIKNQCAATTTNNTFHFIGLLLQSFPSLASRLYPIYIYLIQRTIVMKRATLTLDLLNSLCQHICKADFNCAKETYSKFLEWTDLKMPISLRSTIIRLFPKLVLSNKRMFGRLMEILGKSLQDPSVEIRLAIAATMADFCIRPNDNFMESLIGPLQLYLQQSPPLIAALAITGLHRLCREGCLDYSMTVKVVGKRLSMPIDASAIVKHDPAVVKALITLLGDGEISTCNDSTDEEDVSNLEKPATPKVVEESVRVLNDIASRLISSLTSNCGEEVFMTSDIRQALYSSLSAYSFDALNIDAETVRQSIQSVKDDEDGDDVNDSVSHLNPHGLLLLVILRIIQYEETAADGYILPVDSNKLTALLRKVMLFEQESLGVSLWKRNALQPKSSTDATTYVSKSSLAALPSATLLERHYLEKHSASSAIAYLSCAFGTDIKDDILHEPNTLNLIADLACDISLSTSDPVMRCLIISAWMNSMRNLWMPLFAHSHTYEAKYRLAQKIADFSQSLEQPDNSSIALATSSLVIASINVNSDDSKGKLIDFIHSHVVKAVQANCFSDDDDACLCLCFLAAAYVKIVQWEKVDDLLRLIVHSKNGAGFGYVYGMAVIAQTLDFGIQCNIEISTQESFRPRLQEVLSRITVEFVSLITTSTSNSMLLSLPVMIKCGRPTSDFVNFCRALDIGFFSVIDSDREKCRTCCLALSVALPSLRHINVEFIQGLHYILEKMPSGSGKGFLIPIAIRCCLQAGLLQRHQITSYMDSLLISLDVSKKFLEDEVLAGVGLAFLDSSSHVAGITKVVVRSVEAESRIYDAGGRLSAILALCATLGCLPTIPALAVDGSSVMDPPKLHPNTRKQSIISSVQLLDRITKDFSRDGRTRESALIALGFLSAMKESPVQLHRAIAVESEQRTPSFGQSLSVDFGSIPLAADGTLTRFALDFTASYVKDLPSAINDKARCSTLLMLLCALQSVTLPMQCSRILEYLLRESGRDVQVACFHLLSSQIQLSQRMGDDRRDFVKMLLDISQLPLSSFHTLLKSSESRVAYFSCFAHCLSKLPSGTVEQVIAKLWSNCCCSLQEEELQCAKEFLQSIKYYLKVSCQANKKEGGWDDVGSHVSTIPVRSVISFLLNTAFTSLVDAMTTLFRDNDQSNLDNIKFSVWNEFCECIVNIPIPLIDGASFCSLSANDDRSTLIQNLFRCSAIVRLVSGGVLDSATERKEKELTKVQSWLCRQNVYTLNQNGFFRDDILRLLIRLIAFSLAQATMNVSEKYKKEFIIRAFEAMLVQASLDASFCMEFLAFQSMFWAKEVVTAGWKDESTLLTPALLSFDHKIVNIEFSNGKFIKLLSESLLMDFPVNLAAVCSSLGKEFIEIMSKQALQLCNKLNEIQPVNNLLRHYAIFFRKFYILCGEDPSKIRVTDDFNSHGLETF